MIGFILVTHTRIGLEMMAAVEEILKEKPPLLSVGFDPARPLEETKDKIRAAIGELKDADGIILLTDLYGSTPSNLCMGASLKGKMEIVTGCNLPMVLKAATGRFDGNVQETARFLSEYGREKIRIAGSE